MAGYLRVNEMFADRLQNLVRPDDVIWVHDYHFLPLAKALRDRGVENKIGFFLHIPFPPPDLLTALPKHERIILSLCHYDLVGFQTDNDADNLADYLTNECGCRAATAGPFIAGQRTMRIGVFPVGVEMAEFERLARRASKLAAVREVGTSFPAAHDHRRRPARLFQGHRAADAGVRTIPTNYPRWRGAVTYLQIAPRSRADIREYADMERRIDETVGRVNGRLRRGGLDADPLRQPRATAAPHSQASTAQPRAALVTPLRDGMNLVAKEYVAAQDPEDPGVLILSRFAGAAVECQAALLVNPYDQGAMAAAMDQALSMSLEERQARHGSLVKVLSENDIKHWGTRFIATLTRPTPVASVPRAVAAAGGSYFAAAE